MVLITPIDKRCRYRMSPTILNPFNIRGYLTYGNLYLARPATGNPDWYYMEELDGFAHKSVVKVVQTVGTLPPAIPKYVSQNDLNSNRVRNDCGPACCCMHLNARGCKVTVNEITKSYPSTTSAADLSHILKKYGIDTVTSYYSPVPDLLERIPKYAILLVNYTPLRYFAQDINYTGWHWLLWLGFDPSDKNFCFTHDPDFSGRRVKEGAFKRYPVAAMRKAFKPYSYSCTAITFPDLEGL